MRPSSGIAVLLVASSLASTALARDASRTKHKKRSKRSATVLVASAEPLPPLPPSPPSPPDVVSFAEVPPPVKDRPAVTPSPKGRPSAGAGFVLVLETGATFLGGSIADGLPVGAPLMSVGVKLGGYITPHFGLMAGASGGYGALTAGCDGHCSNAYSYQFPILAQYAFQDRTRGLYVEGGLALLTTYAGSTDLKAHPEETPESITMSAPFDLKLGVGYRLPARATAEKAATSSVDLRLGVDLGQFKSIEYKTVGGDVSGDLAADKLAMHVVVGVSAGYQFAP